MTPQDESAFVLQAQKGDAPAFTSLVREHHFAVRRYLTRLLRDTSVADDLAQEVFVLAFRDLKSYRFSGRFVGWLFGIARHQAQMYLRSEDRRSTRAKQQAIVAWLENDSADVEPNVFETELSALEDCLERMKKPASVMLREYYYLALPVLELAQRHNKTEVAVRVALLRARLWLRSCLDLKLQAADLKRELGRA